MQKYALKISIFRKQDFFLQENLVSKTVFSESDALQPPTCSSFLPLITSTMMSSLTSSMISPTAPSSKQATSSMSSTERSLSLLRASLQSGTFSKLGNLKGMLQIALIPSFQNFQRLTNIFPKDFPFELYYFRRLQSASKSFNGLTRHSSRPHHENIKRSSNT